MQPQSGFGELFGRLLLNRPGVLLIILVVLFVAALWLGVVISLLVIIIGGHKRIVGCFAFANEIHLVLLHLLFGFRKHPPSI